MSPVKGKAGNATKPRKKDKSMEKQVEADESVLSANVEVGEQMDLIDVTPDNIKPIIKIAKQYKAVQSKRVAALEEETSLKQKILAAVKESGIKPLDDGNIRFSHDGFTITIKHRDELIQVKEDSEE